MGIGVVEQLKELITDQPQNPLRPTQVEEFTEEMERMDKHVHAPPYVQGDRGTSRKRYLQIKKMLDEQAPKEVTDVNRQNSIKRLAHEVMETVLKPSMLPQSIMRRNPPGAVDAFNKRENSKAVKDAKLTWKRAMWALDPHCTDQDFTNLEKHRPPGSGDGVSTFMAESQIPGHHAMTPGAKDNWPLGEPTAKTAIDHLEPTEAAPSLEVPCECRCGEILINPRKGKKFFSKECYMRETNKRRTMKLRGEGGE